ncbi:glycoside hydrolase family 108 protein [Mucilaginibacter sp. KACC 22063]|uniref:glycoside hydrolase family 108 protein n=1 Tax=Mucilaginibacter sp. KACC 22063 TaxID=3025666 RepID=UPI00236607FB|nr:glycosyl hydrolase 108 family protein [Mucilaginibacter sp. KACC 22063]WDF53905.1 glycosyl hydrolase 108 family protein [Mucilaginibacter sp. KACC 22063]
MAIFIIAFKITLGNEGGYANNPDDSGGETYMGVTRNYWPQWAGWAIVDQIMATKPQSINAALGGNSQLQADVQAFYKQNFWDVLSLDNLNGQQLGNQLFDTAVNMGTGIAGRFLQQGINNIATNKITVDGMVGPITIAAANAIPEEQLYNQVIALRRQRYLNIIAANPSQFQFQNAWLSRLTPYNPQLA